MPQSDQLEKKQTLRRMAVVAASFLLTVPWLCFSVRFALNSGADCDVWRQWTVSQYVHHGINPYQVSLDILKLNYGEMRGPDRLRLIDFKIYEVHPNMDRTGVTNVLEEYGPPTATYPPSSLLPLAYTVGLLPSGSVHVVWLVVCLLTLVTIWRHFCRYQPPFPEHAGQTALLYAAILLLWPPMHEALRTLQFIFLVSIFAWIAIQNIETKPVRAGIFMALALIKPSVALPFMVIPLVRRKWVTIAVVAILHGVAWGILSVLVHVSPLVLLDQWTEIPRYFLLGAYSIQEIINWLGLDNTTAGSVITLGFAAGCAAWCWVHRRAECSWHLAFLSFASVLWTYHERYDFFILLMPLALCLRRSKSSPVIMITGFVVLGLALTDAVYLADSSVAHVARWAGRLALFALTVHGALALRSVAREST